MVENRIDAKINERVTPTLEKTENLTEKIEKSTKNEKQWKPIRQINIGKIYISTI